MLMRYLRIEIRLMFGLHWRPDQWLFAQRPRQIAVQRRNHGSLTELLCLRYLRLSCVRLGRRIRKRAKAEQRYKYAGQAEN